MRRSVKFLKVYLTVGRERFKSKKLDDSFFKDALDLVMKIHREDELMKKRGRIADFDRELEKESKNVQ